ncbi:MAG TPA: hypothetical protein VH254_06325 [Candidatus Udaeobacter sp.]|nr:hypothetical protein [Candidatus Udaeobacter sp.]
MARGSDIPERDWKLFRQLRPIALERFCEKVLSEIGDISGSDESAHKRYLRVFKIVRDRDKELATLFDDPRRSIAWLQLSLIHSHGLFTVDEMQRFSRETQQRARELAKLRI